MDIEMGDLHSTSYAARQRALHGVFTYDSPSRPGARLSGGKCQTSASSTPGRYPERYMAKAREVLRGPAYCTASETL